MPYRMVIRHHIRQQPLRPKLLHDIPARLRNPLPLIRPRLSVQRPVQIHHANHRQPMTLPYLKVSRIMPRRHLQRPRPEPQLHRLVPYHWQHPPQHWQPHPLADMP